MELVPLGSPTLAGRFITTSATGEVNDAEVDVFLELPCLLHDPTNVDNLVCGSSASSKHSLYIWKFFVHVLLKPSLEDFEHSLTSMENQHNWPTV